MKKALSVFLVLILMLTMLAGCGKVKKGSNAGPKNDPLTTQNRIEEEDEPIIEDEPEDEPNEAPKKNTSSPFAKEFLPLNSAQDILKTFKEFGYAYNSKQEGQEVTTWSFHYVYLGQEKIDGEDTQHFSATQVEKDKTTEYEVWLNSEWNAVKYKDANGEKTGLDAGFSGAGLMMMTQLYSNYTALAGMVFEADGNVNEIIYKMKGKRATGESVDFGTGTPTQIDLYDIEDKISHNDKLLGLSKFNGFMMYTVIETINEDTGSLEGMRITHAVPH